MQLTVQECLAIACIRDTKFGVWLDGQVTDGELAEDVPLEIQERRFIGALRDYGSYRELKFTDGLPMGMKVEVPGPSGTVYKQIRFDKD